MIKHLFFDDATAPIASLKKNVEDKEVLLDARQKTYQSNGSKYNDLSVFSDTTSCLNINKCLHCAKICKSTSGLKLHLKACGKKKSIQHLEDSKAKSNQSIDGNQKEAIAMPSSTDVFPTAMSRPPPVPVWGKLTLEDVTMIIDNIYDEVVFWRRNVFLLPSGTAGKKFIKELTRMIDIWNSDYSPLKEIALKAMMVMPALLLQKPSYKSKAKDHSACLARRLELWEIADFDALAREARTIQGKLQMNGRQMDQENLAKTFAKLMFEGKVNAALKLLDNTNTGGILPLTTETLHELKSKHPEASPATEEVLMTGELPFSDPAVFNNIDEDTIIKAALRTRGACGPSGLDASGWRHILVSKSYGSTGKELCASLAKFARLLCTRKIEIKPSSQKKTNLEAYVACRLIPLDKKPGVRPIGVGEVLRRIIGKAIISIVKPEIIESAGSLQLCAGQQAGCEAAVHAMADIFAEEATDGILLVDASNAFNALNRNVLLHNIRYICPEISTYVWNCYCVPSRLFVTGGSEIKSSEGTTQGDPTAMAIYALGITPLLASIRPEPDPDIRHVAFADDLGGAGKFRKMKYWWDKIVEVGPKLGYYPNASKSWLIVKSEAKRVEAEKIFEDTNVNIIVQGRKYLGSFVGSEEGKYEYASNLVKEWCDQLLVLSKIAKSQPQAAFTSFISGFKHKITYFIRTFPEVQLHIAAFDKVIDSVFIPAFTDGHICSSDERLLLSLPARMGGLALPIFADTAPEEYQNSILVTAQLVDNIKQQKSENSIDLGKMKKVKREIGKKREENRSTMLSQLRERLNKEDIRANDLATMRGASSWLTTLPLESEKFVLNKREFFDAINLRYRWPLKYLPSICPCSKVYSVDHAMSCPKGGFLYMRHDEMKDSIANLLQETCKDVEVEPRLIPLTGEALPPNAIQGDEARLDIAARSFWQRGQRAFFDVRVFNPFASSHVNQNLQKVFCKNEKEKKRKYNQRVIEIEHGSFTPLVFSSHGGCSRETERFIKELSLKLARRQGTEEGVVMSWLRTKISFTLLKSAILCIRGSRTLKRNDMPTDPSNILISQSVGRIDV